MKKSLKDRFYVWASNWSLDWLEKLPKFEGGGIADRQHVRKRQREEAKKAQEHTKQPKDTSVDFLFFRLIEVFHIEDVARLRRGVKKLLPFVDSIFWHSDFSDMLAQQANQIQSGGGFNLGYLVRDDKSFLGTESRVLPELPEEVSDIHLFLRHIYPSLFVITFDVFLTKDATNRLMRVHGKERLSTVRFLKLIPWGIKAWSMAGENTSERAIRHEVLRWIDELRGKVEACIRPYLKGHFFSQSPGKQSALPAIEVIALKGAPSNPEEFDKWLKEHRAWWWSLGFGHDFLMYKSNSLLHVDPGNDSPYGRTVQRFVPLWESYWQAVPDMWRNHGERNAIAFNMAAFLDSLLTIFVLIEYLQSVQKNIEKLRDQSFGKMRPSWRLALRMNKYIKLNDAIQRQDMLLNRIAMEYEHSKKQLEIDVNGAASGLKMNDSHFAKHLGSTLSERFLKYIGYYFEFLKKNLAFISESFSQHLATRNMEIMYQLQRRMFWLTVVVTVATFLTVFASWENIKTFYSELKKLLGY
nr:hypothetical protein [uncultured bacterium]